MQQKQLVFSVRWRSNLIHTAKQAIAPGTCVVFTICVTAPPLTPIGSEAVGDEDTIHGSEKSVFGVEKIATLWVKRAARLVCRNLSEPSL